MKSLTTNLGVVGIMLISFVNLSAQSATVQSGNWNSPSIWSTGIVPDASSGSIIINHKINISIGTLLIDEVTLNDTLLIESGATVVLNNASGTTADLRVTAGGLKVQGTLICRDGATFSGTTNTNTFFYDGSTYRHQYFNTAGTPPNAYWGTNSNLEITGYTTTKTLSDALWSQSFGNVIYNSPDLATSASIEFVGKLQNIKGNFLIKSTGLGYIRLSASATTSTTIRIGGDLIIEGRSRVWFSREATTSVFVGGDFRILSTATANCYLTTTGTCDINVAGDFEMNSTSPLRFASATASGRGYLRVKQNFIFRTGAIDVTSGGDGLGTIELNGTSPQLFTSLGSWTSGVNLLINNNTGIKVEANSKVEGNVVVASKGKLILPESSFILHGDLTVQDGGFVDANKGTLVLAGSFNQSISVSGGRLHHININKSTGSKISFLNDTKLAGILSVLSTNTTVHSNGNLTILSLSDDGTADASINTLPTGSSILGNVNVQRFMSGEGRIYRYLSSPVSNASIDSLMDDFPITGTFTNPSTGPGIRSSSPSFYFYNETLINPNGWIPYPSSGLASENSLEIGKGYSAFIRESSKSTTWDITGVVNQGEIIFPVTFTNTNDPTNDGWNLVGNPYPSSIDWDAASGWQKTNVNNGIAVRDNGLGRFLYWDGEIGSLGNGHIAMGQSFWVKANNLNPLLRIKEIAKTSLASPFYRKRILEPDYIEVSISSTKLTERTYLRLRDHASRGYDSLDIAKFSNDFINLSFEVNKIPLAISAVSELDCSQAHVLNLSFAKNSDGSFVQSPVGNYSISVNTFGLFDVKEIILHDAFKNLDVNLKASPYSFLITADSASYKSNRFSLLFKAPMLSDSVSVISDSVVCDNSAAYAIHLKNTQPNTQYKLFTNNSMLGYFLSSQNDSLLFELDPKELNNGVTNMKVIASNLCFTKEVKQFLTWKEQIHTPSLIAEKSCNTNQTTLHIQNGKGAVTFNWYDHNKVLIEQTRDSSLVVMIQKPTTFYVTSVFDHGCISNPSSAYAEVFRYDKSMITEDNGILYSNHLINNQWSLDGQEIPSANQSTFKPTTTGNYTLTILHEGCVDSVSYNFIYQDEACHVFPNPVEDEVQIVAPFDEQIVRIEILNTSGQSLGIIDSERNTKALAISMQHLAAGIYSLNVMTAKNRYFIRISKK